MKNSLILLLAVLMLTFSSCSKEEDKGKQSPMGEVGNNFTIGTIPGVNSSSAYVSALNNGVSTVTVTADLSNQTYINIANAMAQVYPNEVSMSGNVVTLDIKARFTDKGISVVYPDGEELTYCEYDAGVGSSWSATSDGKVITSTITEKTGVDDYSYGFWLIKVSEATVETQDLALLGVQDFKLYFNHKFGLVGVKGDLGSNGLVDFNVYSDVEN